MSVIKLSNTSDYIAPSAACTNPKALVDDSPAPPKGIVLGFEDGGGSNGFGGGGVNGGGGGGGLFGGNAAKEEEKKSEKALKITLSDCLACTGCVTTSESVLLSSQNSSEVKRRLKEGGESLAFMVSIQSFIELERHYGNVVGAKIGGGIVETMLNARLQDYCRRHAGNGNNAFRGLFSASPDTIMNSWFNCCYDEFLSRASTSRCTLTSSCPGFVCYVEKTATSLLPMLSNVMSPMAMSAAALRSLVGAGTTIVSVEPCHDKKLEGSREDIQGVDLVVTTKEIQDCLEEEGWNFLNWLSEGAPAAPLATGGQVGNAGVGSATVDVDASMDVDMDMCCDDDVAGGMEVEIAPQEAFHGLLPQHQPGQAQPPLAPESYRPLLSSGSLISYFNSGSGGVIEAMVRVFVSERYGLGQYLDYTAPLPWGREGKRRGTDGIRECWVCAGVPREAGSAQPPRQREFFLSAPPSTRGQTLEANVEVLHKFAICYGFSSIQSLQASLKKSPNKYDYVEVMACPHGCLNGGGGISDSSVDGGGGAFSGGARLSAKSRVKEAFEIAKQYNTVRISRHDAGGLEGRLRFRTTFKAIEPTKLYAGALNGVQVKDTVW